MLKKLWAIVHDDGFSLSGSDEVWMKLMSYEVYLPAENITPGSDADDV